jgi:hypothetical protein
MATTEQTEANRQNSQKSTGPRSPAGKAVSRFNALKSGIDAESHVIPGEDPAKLETLVAEYQARFDTSAPERRMLVDTMIACEWQVRRLNHAEACFRVYEAMCTEPGYSSKEHPEGRVVFFGDKIFDRLQRRVNAVQRNWERALKQLKSLQDIAGADQPPDTPAPPLNPPETTPPEPPQPSSNQ